MSTNAHDSITPAPSVHDVIDRRAPTEPPRRAVVVDSEAPTKRIRPVPSDVRPRDEITSAGRYVQVFGRTNKPARA